MDTLNYFWNWFTDNQRYFVNYLKLLPKERQHYTFWMEWHLNYYCNGVGFVMVFTKKSNQKNKLIITAKGRSENYEKVEAIVAAAPRFNNWEIIAFVQPSANIDEIREGMDRPYIYQGISLKVSEVNFKPIENCNDKKIGLIIFLKYDNIDDDYQSLIQIVYIMIESILGEKILHENINSIKLDLLSATQNFYPLLELYDLKQYLIESNNMKIKSDKN